MSAGEYRVGFDVGGTFTDFVLLDEASGALTVLKMPSTPERPSASVFAGIEALARGQGVDPAAIEAAFIEASRAADVVITSGGVSVGEADFVEDGISTEVHEPIYL